MIHHSLIAPRLEESTSRRARPNRSALVVCALFVALILGLTTSFSPAQTSMELTRWREFSYAKETRMVGGRMAALEAVHRTGFVVVGDGEFARLNGWVVHTASPDGKEYHQGFVMYDFQDGSSILAKVDASGQPGTKQMGTIVFVEGTKRFKGITGRGTISAWMPVKWDMYTEVDASFSVSPN
ncbi:hypothetical protein [Anaerobaca lacustris]|jgi:hypothetical protein|uniref:Dirigent protein n=1 Tax=Anaerobaca lacustris TaxID=3044600 RepID=A0AAW6TYE3_9BACT|nr:hypothetical protein [Sedimentisphaerales bacterium M17dextr]